MHPVWRAVPGFVSAAVGSSWRECRQQPAEPGGTLDCSFNTWLQPTWATFSVISGLLVSHPFAKTKIVAVITQASEQLWADVATPHSAIGHSGFRNLTKVYSTGFQSVSQMWLTKGWSNWFPDKGKLPECSRLTLVSLFLISDFLPNKCTIFLQQSWCANKVKCLFLHQPRNPPHGYRLSSTFYIISNKFLWDANQNKLLVSFLGGFTYKLHERKQINKMYSSFNSCTIWVKPSTLM